MLIAGVIISSLRCVYIVRVHLYDIRHSVVSRSPYLYVFWKIKGFTNIMFIRCTMCIVQYILYSVPALYSQ